MPATKRYAYCPVSAFTSTTTTSTTNSSSSYTAGTYKVTTSLLKVRSGAGTSYSAKKYSQLTANARAQNKALGNYYANGYLKGVVSSNNIHFVRTMYIMADEKVEKYFKHNYFYKF